MKQQIIRRNRVILEFHDILFFEDVLIKNTKIGEVDLVLIDGKLRYFERNIRSGIEHEDYYYIKYISEKLKVNDYYKVII